MSNKEFAIEHEEQLKTFDNAFDVIGKACGIIKAKAEMIICIRELIKKSGMKQSEAAELLSVSQPRVSALMRGEIDSFSVDMLLKFLSAFDYNFKFEFSMKNGNPNIQTYFD